MWRLTLSRTPSSTSSAPVPDTATSRSSSARDPATATIRSRRCAGSDRAAIRPARMSRNVAGRTSRCPLRRSTAMSAPVVPAALLERISSAKNGLPSARAWIRSASPRSGGCPRMPSSWRRCSSRSSGRRSIRSTCRLRPVSASWTSSGWPDSSTSVRKVPTTMTRPRRRFLTTNASRSRVAGSLQWRSSRITTSWSVGPESVQ